MPQSTISSAAIGKQLLLKWVMLYLYTLIERLTWLLSWHYHHSWCKRRSWKRREEWQWPFLDRSRLLVFVFVAAFMNLTLFCSFPYLISQAYCWINHCRVTSAGPNWSWWRVKAIEDGTFRSRSSTIEGIQKGTKLSGRKFCAFLDSCCDDRREF